MDRKVGQSDAIEHKRPVVHTPAEQRQPQLRLSVAESARIAD